MLPKGRKKTTRVDWMSKYDRGLIVALQDKVRQGRNSSYYGIHVGQLKSVQADCLFAAVLKRVVAFRVR